MKSRFMALALVTLGLATFTATGCEKQKHSGMLGAIEARLEKAKAYAKSQGLDLDNLGDLGQRGPSGAGEAAESE